ncbi:hypothetical protein KAT80_02995 [Candidatus Pacearchaeota archaeon]|nr:hypothetical protein [Candidatus Pacearchaeota archaeon]
MGGDLAISFLTFVALLFYAYYTRRIAKEGYIPLISMTIKQINKSHLQFYIRNHSKVEIESFGKIKADTSEGVFEFNTGFYGDESPWILQPFMEGIGHFDLKDLLDKQKKTLGESAKSGKIEHMQFVFYLKYRKFREGKWKKPQPQKWIYNFKTNAFWLDV